MKFTTEDVTTGVIAMAIWGFGAGALMSLAHPDLSLWRCGLAAVGLLFVMRLVKA